MYPPKVENMTTTYRRVWLCKYAHGPVWPIVPKHLSMPTYLQQYYTSDNLYIIVCFSLLFVNYRKHCLHCRKLWFGYKHCM